MNIYVLDDPNLRKKIFCSTMKLHFGWMSTLINKIVAFEVMIIHKLLRWCLYILTKSLFVMLYEQRESLVHIYSKVKPAIMLVNGEHYMAIVNEFFVPESDDIDVDDLWYTANETKNLLKETFDERIISRGEPRLCDLTPPNFF